MRVLRINITPVKGLGLQHPQSVELGPHGVAENRRFLLVREDGRMFNGKDFGPLVQVRPESLLDGGLVLGDTLTVDMWGRPLTCRVVEGPAAAELSELVGRELRLVRVEEPESAVDVHPGTLVSAASAVRLGEELDAEVDLRRFRMLLELEGPGPHEEDTWQGCELQVGEAVVRVAGPVPRCVVTTQDPDTGVRTLETLRALRAYRPKVDFGMYFDVVRPGRVALGDAVVAP